MFDIRGVWSKEEWENMLRTVPMQGPKIVKDAARDAMKVMQGAMRSAIPPAVTKGHSNRSIVQSVGLGVRSKDNVITVAKTGIGVGMLREDEKALLFASKSKRQSTVAPHAHLYIMGTADRWTGRKRVRNKKEMGSREKYRYEQTGNPRLYKGRMDPSRYMPRQMAAVIAANSVAVERKFVESVTKRIGKIVNGV